MPVKYWFMHRPPTYAQLPDGATATEVYYPAQPVKIGPDDYTAYFFGWATYPAALPFEVIDHWSMTPDDLTERAQMIFWEFANHNQSDAEFYVSDYVAAYRRGELSANDYMFVWTEILAGAHNERL